MSLVAGVLVASLLGSVHCAGMCGGFVCLYAATGETGARAWRSHLSYNIGRLLTYLSLGAVAGGTGRALDNAGAALGVTRLATVVAGTLLVGWGLASLLALRGVRLSAWVPVSQSRIGTPIARAVGWLRDQPAALRALGTGVLTTLIPCGWLYTFVATAGSTGSVRGGALVMLAFWLGTVPMLLAVGAGMQRAFPRLRTRLPALSAALVLAMGVLSLTGRLVPLASHATHAAGSSMTHAR